MVEPIVLNAAFPTFLDVAKFNTNAVQFSRIEHDTIMGDGINTISYYIDPTADLEAEREKFRRDAIRNNATNISLDFYAEDQLTEFLS